MTKKILSAMLGIGAITSLHAQQKPNVVFILADDLGYGDLSSYGQEKFSTPNIDKLALNGTRFTRSYSGTTVSAPSRASLLTGLHTGHTPIRGNREVQPEGQAPLPAESYTIFRMFKEAGYRTGVFGKWGLGYPGSEGDPMHQGVDQFFGFICQRMAHNYYPSHLWSNNKKVEFPENLNGALGTYSQDLIQKKTLEFIESQKEEPFFLYVPFMLPHAELIVPDDTVFQSLKGLFPETPYKGKEPGDTSVGGYRSQAFPRATHAAMVKRIDLYVAEIVQKIKEEGVYDNTLIIFTSDNGPVVDDGYKDGAVEGLMNHKPWGPFRGGKYSTFEAGTRVPFIVHWPERVDAKVSPALVSQIDMTATMAALVGLDRSPGIPEDSQNQLNAWLGLELNGRDYVIGAASSLTVLTREWKYIEPGNGRPYNALTNTEYGNSRDEQLYNIVIDRGVYDNVANENPQRLERMKLILEREKEKGFNLDL